MSEHGIDITSEWVCSNSKVRKARKKNVFLLSKVDIHLSLAIQLHSSFYVLQNTAVARSCLEPGQCSVHSLFTESQFPNSCRKDQKIPCGKSELRHPNEHSDWELVNLKYTETVKEVVYDGQFLSWFLSPKQSKIQMTGRNITFKNRGACSTPDSGVPGGCLCPVLIKLPIDILRLHSSSSGILRPNLWHNQTCRNLTWHSSHCGQHRHKILLHVLDTG